MSIFKRVWSSFSQFESVDDKILQYMMDSGAEFIMEVTDKTKADVKVKFHCDVVL